MASNQGSRGGPFIKAAFLCERVLDEKDGVSTFVRVIDRWSINAELRLPPGAEPQEQASVQLPEDLPEFQWNATLVLQIVPGSATGRAIVRLTLEEPSGLRRSLRGPFDVNYERPNAAVNVRGDVSLPLRQEGVYWIHVEIDGAEITQIPFEIRYQRT